MSVSKAALSIAEQSDRQRGAPVSELFYSFQGEGPNLGRRALFIRYMRCNLTCGYAKHPDGTGVPPDGAMVCDTEYTWNVGKHDLMATVRHLTPQQVWAELRGLDPASSDTSLRPVDLLVVSGGEPLLHQDDVVGIAQFAIAAGMRVEIETNATIRPNAQLLSESNVWFNAGLKLASSAVPEGKRIKPEAIQAIQDSGRARWKFVVCTEQDLAEAAELVAAFGLTEVWLSPEGTTSDAVIERMRAMAAPALARGWHLTCRQHVLIWGGERSR